MRQREFDAFRLSEPIRFCGGQFLLAVETLGNTCRYSAKGEEPVEDQRPMTPQALDDVQADFGELG